MTLKAAAADLGLGGGKGVIMAPADGPLTSKRRHAALLDFADTVQSLDGRYITAEDVGTSSRDMSVIAGRTSHVAGLARSRGGSGDPSPLTARGVEVAIAAACERAFSDPDLGRRTICRDRPRSRGLAGRHALRPRRREPDRGRRRRRQGEAGRAARRPLVHAPRRRSRRRSMCSFPAPSAACSTTSPCRACAAGWSRGPPTTSSPMMASPICWPGTRSSGCPTSSSTRVA